MEQILLECKNVSKRQGDFELKDINFQLPAGYIMGVIGRNGAGKSTLLNILLQGRNKGADIRLNGVSAEADVVGYREQIGFVLNETPFPLVFHGKNCGKVYGSYYKDFDYDKYLRLLENYGIDKKKRLKAMSKGEQIKQQLAFALATNAKLFVMDEPVGNLDPIFQRELQDILREIIQEEKASVIYVSHLVEEMELFTDYLLWLDKGEQKYFGTMEGLRDEYQMIETDLELSKLQNLQSRDKMEITSCIRSKRIGGAHQEYLVKCRAEDLPKELKDSVRRAELKEIMDITGFGLTIME